MAGKTEQGGISQIGASPSLVVCAGIYWATMLLGNFEISSMPGTTTTAYGSSFFVVYAIFIATMLVATCLVGKFVDVRAQKVLAWVAVACSAVTFASLFAGTLSESAALLVRIVRGICIACYIMFWGLNFTALDKNEAERTAIWSLGVAFVLYLLCTLLLRDATVLLGATNIMMIVSLVPFLAGRYRIDIVRRPDAAPNAKVLVPFFASRVFFGICFGISAVLCHAIVSETEDRAVALSLATIAVMIVSFWYLWRTDTANLTFLRLAPFVACGAIICPFLTGDDLLASLFGHVPSIIWLCCIILHSVQISAIKDESGIDDALLSFVEKIVFMVFVVLSVLVVTSVPGLQEAIGGTDQTACTTLAVVAFLMVVVCSYQLNRVIDGKETRRITENAFELAEQRHEPVYEELGGRFGLTAREMDVFRLLAKGYARPAICEELCISEGTERSHVRHIYQKMDIHSRDELFALVEEASRERVASSSTPRSRPGNTG